jgi:hypothetical protein
VLPGINAKAATELVAAFVYLRMSTVAVMTRAGLEPATYGLKVRCSTN